MSVQRSSETELEKLSKEKTEYDDKPEGGAKEKPIKSPHSPRTFTCTGHLSNHLVSHSSQRPFTCDHCNKSFAQRHHLKSHITHRHTMKQDRAAHLNATTMTNLQSNQSPPLSFSCVECGKAFAQKNHLASHVYHKHPHAYVRKSSPSSSNREGEASGSEGGASGSVGGDSCREGTTGWGGAPSPGLKSSREQPLADLDVGGRSLMESPFMRGNPSTLEKDQQHSSTREVLTLQGGSRESPSTRATPTMSKGLSGREKSGDHAVVKGSSSSKRRKLSVALGDHASPDVPEGPQPACLPAALQSTVTPPTKNMANSGTVISFVHSVLPQQPFIVLPLFPAGMGGVQQNSPVNTGSFPGFYIFPLSIAMASPSVQQLSSRVQSDRDGTGFTGNGDVHNDTGQPLESRVLKKYEERFIDVVAANEIAPGLYRWKVIPQSIMKRIEKSDSDKHSRELLFDHLKQHGNVDSLKAFCEEAILADGYPNMQSLVRDMKAMLEREDNIPLDTDMSPPPAKKTKPTHSTSDPAGSI